MSSNTARCKFVATSVEKKGNDHIEVELQARYDSEVSNDDRAYSKATPTGSFTATITNPSVIGMFEEGRAYYLDISPVPIDAKGRTAKPDKDAADANADSDDGEATPAPATGPETAGGSGTQVRGGNSPITRHGG
jgi:hypothetical protein